MKPATLLPPVCALIAAALWLGSQQRSIDELETRIAKLSSTSPGRFTLPHESSPVDQARKSPPSKIDWKALVKNGTNLMGYPRTPEQDRIRKILLGMTPQELAAALDEIDASEISSQLKDGCEGGVLEVLGGKDPLLALQKSGKKDLTKQSIRSELLAMALKNLAMKDLPAATAWMDEALREGRLEPKGLGPYDERSRFEANLISAAILSDPAMADARIVAMTKREKINLFNQTALCTFPPEADVEMSRLVKTHFDLEYQQSFLARFSYNLVLGGTERVDHYFQASEATTAEKSPIVRSLFNRAGQAGDPEQSGEKIDTLRSWASTQTPDEVDQMTGRALSMMANKDHYPGAESRQKSSPKAVALVLHYAEKDSAAGSVVVEAFLSNLSPPIAPETLPLLEKITDPARREQLRNRLQKK